MNKIINNLWISDLHTVINKPTDSFDHIIGVCQSSAKDDVDCDYTHFNMSDGPAYRGRSDYELFEESATLALNQVQQGNNVLIHCHMGQSRSAAVTIAVIGAHKNIPYNDAYNLVSDKRDIHPMNNLQEHAKRFIEEHTDITHQF